MAVPGLLEPHLLAPRGWGLQCPKPCRRGVTILSWTIDNLFSARATRPVKEGGFPFAHGLAFSLRQLRTKPSGRNYRRALDAPLVKF